MRRKAAMLIAAAALSSGCETSGPRVELGELLNPALIDPEATACDLPALTQLETAEPELSDFFADEIKGETYEFAFDLSREGRPVNIRYTGDPEYAGAPLRGIRASLEAIRQWRFEIPDRRPRSGCRAEVEIPEPFILPRDRNTQYLRPYR